MNLTGSLDLFEIGSLRANMREQEKRHVFVHNIPLFCSMLRVVFSAASGECWKVHAAMFITVRVTYL